MAGSEPGQKARRAIFNRKPLLVMAGFALVASGLVGQSAVSSPAQALVPRAAAEGGTVPAPKVTVQEGPTYDRLSGYPDNRPEVGLHHGHTDIFNLSAPSDSELKLEIKEDITGSEVLRAPESVFLKVLKDRYADQTKGNKEIGVPTYILPLAQESNSLWPGLDTFRIEPHLGKVGATFVAEEVTGPGKVFLFSSANFGKDRPRLEGNSWQFKTGSRLTVEKPKHEHFYWAFDKPGIYTFKVHAEAQNKAGKTLRSNTGTYTWLVDTPYPQPGAAAGAAGAAGTPGTGASASGVGAGLFADDADGQGKPAGNGAGAAPAGKPGDIKVTMDQAKAWENCDQVRKAGVGPIKKADYPALYNLVKDKLDPENSGLACPIDSNSLALEYDDNTLVDKDQKLTAKAAALITSCEELAKAIGNRPVRESIEPKLYHILSKKLDDEKDGVLCEENSSASGSASGSQSGGASGGGSSAGASGGGSPTVLQASKEQCLPTKIPLAKGSSPATNPAPTSTTSFVQGYGSKVIPANTHVHQNWVFNKPGRYEVVITETGTLKNGKKVSADAVLHFNVGGSGSKNEGHFDLGAQVSGGRFFASLKDDSVSPARWVDPSSIVFGLGPNSKRKAPAGIEFIANAGQDIWLIPSTQIPGVPWLGANTMHPSVINETTGPITWTLKSVKGPGQLAVFASGNFGKIVGEFWFGGIGGKVVSKTTGNTGGNSPGYRIEGRTANGEVCELASTGTSSQLLLILMLGGGMLILGAGALTLRKVQTA